MSTSSAYSKIPILETENYIVRGLTIADATKLFEFLGDKETMKFLTPHPVTTEGKMKEKIVEQLKLYEDQKEIPWVIVNKRNEEIVGQFSFHKLNMWHKKAEMGVVIRKEYQQKGVMREVLVKLLEFGFETLGLNRIVGDIFAENIGSEKLLTRFGFTKEGVMRQTDFDGENYHDTVVFSLMRSEYFKVED
ncbi:GNAT family N-acetyltransferase [Virgibacillus flavescens]|uniref:GNAT family N-acetyltransferase n=1 Tax=Virgibacillus flavescens TaxID=1611422 RepID=UPI003D3296B0